MDLTSAEQALAEGNLKHAVEHIAPVVLEHPEAQDALRLFHRIIAAHRGDPFELVPLNDDIDAGTAALHALLCALKGRADKALALAVQIVAAFPGSRIFSWLQKWTGDPSFVRSLSIESATDHLYRFVFQFPDFGGDEIVPRLSEILDVVENLRLPYPDHHRLGYVHSLTLRRLGRFEEGLAIAREVLENATDFESVVGLAAALREAGKPEEAIKAYERALSIDPASASVLLDIGDIHFDLDRIGEGLKAYEQSLQLQPEQAWAIASIEYGRLRMTGDSDHLDRLDDLAAAGNERAATLAMAATPFFGFLPPPNDATINMLRQIDLRGPTRAVQITLSEGQSPSSGVATERWAAAKRLSGVEVSIVGIDPRPAAAAPASEKVVDAVEALASTPYDANRWFELARNAAVPDIHDLAACMAHPADQRTTRYSPWTWIQRIQFAAAMLIATFDLDVPWKDSQRRKTLQALIHGPLDWSSSAAIVALTTAAMNGAADAAEVQRWMVKMAERGDEALIFSLLNLPNLDPEVRESLRKQRAPIVRELYGVE